MDVVGVVNKKFGVDRCGWCYWQTECGCRRDTFCKKRRNGTEME